MTTNHNYNTPAAGTTDWHFPLNENFNSIDADIEVRDTNDARGEYDPIAGAKFLATDTGDVYVGDGSAWNRLGSVADSSNDVITVDTNSNVADIIESASPGDIIRLQPGTHKASRSITVATADMTVLVPAGAVLKAPDGIVDEQRFIRVEADGVTLRGDGVIDGNLENAETPSGNGHEHILQVGAPSIAVSEFTLDGLTLDRAPGGDCLYVNKVTDSTFVDFVADGGYRNSISVIDAERLVFDNFMAINASGQSPQAGLAFEQNGPGQPLDTIKVSNGMMSGNVNYGTYINNENADRTLGSDVVDITYTDCTFANNGDTGSYNVKTKGVERLRFDTCVSRNNDVAGWEIGGVRGARLDNCSAWDNGNTSVEPINHAGVYLLEDQADATALPKVVLNGFEAYDTQSTKTQQHPGAVNDGTLRVIDARVGPHAAGQDGFRSNGESSTTEHALVDVESGDVPAYSTDGGNTTNL